MTIDELKKEYDELDIAYNSMDIHDVINKAASISFKEGWDACYETWKEWL